MSTEGPACQKLIRIPFYPPRALLVMLFLIPTYSQRKYHLEGVDWSLAGRPDVGVTLYVGHFMKA